MKLRINYYYNIIHYIFNKVLMLKRFSNITKFNQWYVLNKRYIKYDYLKIKKEKNKKLKYNKIYGIGSAKYIWNKKGE